MHDSSRGQSEGFCRCDIVTNCITNGSLARENNIRIQESLSEKYQDVTDVYLKPTETE